MSFSRKILENLKNLDQYLAQFHQTQQSTYFEKFIAEVFSHILYLPFYASDNDDTNVPHRVTWQGSNSKRSKALSGKPDAIAYCYNFYLVIEATLKTGTKQWSQEFAQSIRRCEDFCSQNNIQSKDIFVLLVCTDLHRDTYQSIKNNPTQYNLVPIKISELTKIFETSIWAFTIRHLELRRLLHQISDSIKKSSSIDDFSKRVNDDITKWQNDVLTLEKTTFIGIKSYEIMREIGRNQARNHAGVSEIFQRLQNSSVVKQYFDTIGDKIGMDIIRDSLIQQSLASKLTFTYEGEELFEPVPYVDFKGRSLRLIKAVEKING